LLLQELESIIHVLVSGVPTIECAKVPSLDVVFHTLDVGLNVDVASFAIEKMMVHVSQLFPRNALLIH
jgi:hypothetical protein